MRSLPIAISVISLSLCLLAPPTCDARGGGGHAAPAHAFYPNGSSGTLIRGPLPQGSNGYAYRPVGAGYWGRRYRGGGYYGGYNQAANDNYMPAYKPVDNSFDEWNRNEAKRLRSLPTTAFVKEYSWASSRGVQQVAASNTQQVAAKAVPAVH